MQIKGFKLTNISADAGRFTGLASVYGNKDAQGDVVDRGAFAQTLRENGQEVPILWQHDPSSPIGIGALTDTPRGLQISGKLSLGTTKGQDVYQLLKDGVIRGMSIGYDVVRKSFENGARHLQALRLYEVSLVTFPANADALVAAVKSGRAISRDNATKLKAIQTRVSAMKDAHETCAKDAGDVLGLIEQLLALAHPDDDNDDDSGADEIAKSLRRLNHQMRHGGSDSDLAEVLRRQNSAMRGAISQRSH